MKKNIFRGSGVALVTPMNDDGSINYNILGELVEFHIQNKTDAIISCGTTGESATLTHEEHNEVIKYTVDHVRGRIPVIAGTGSNNTEHAVRLSKEAAQLGADGLLVVTPYYNKTSQSGLLKHYFKIADSVDVPIIVYNVPSRTGCSVKPETYAKLAKHPNICAAKEASGDISAVGKILSLCRGDLDIYSGNDDQTVPVLSLGGIGVISVFANICPDISHNIAGEYLKGNVTDSTALQLKYLKLMNALFCDVNPIPVKAAMNIMGFPCGKCRLPLDIMDEESHEKLKEIMREYSLESMH